MAKVTWKGSTLLAPVPPVMVSCGTMENANIITVAWCGITNTVPPKTYISVRPKRHSYNIIKESGVIHRNDHGTLILLFLFLTEIDLLYREKNESRNYAVKVKEPSNQKHQDSDSFFCSMR